MYKKSHPQKAVFCDLDETLYPRSTIQSVGKWLLDHGFLPHSAYRKIIWWLILRKLGLLNDEEAFKNGVQFLAGWSLKDLDERVAQAYQDRLASRITPGVRQLCVDWKKAGYLLVMATESLEPIAEVVARDLGFDAVLATKLEFKNKIVTGELGGPVLHNAAKNAAVIAWAAHHKVELAQSLAVGGRLEDTPLLELVGYPIALNPDHALRSLAQKRNWQIIENK